MVEQVYILKFKKKNTLCEALLQQPFTRCVLNAQF